MHNNVVGRRLSGPPKGPGGPHSNSIFEASGTAPEALETALPSGLTWRHARLICKKRGAERVVVAGYSFGAHVAAFAWDRARGPWR